MSRFCIVMSYMHFSFTSSMFTKKNFGLGTPKSGTLFSVSKVRVSSPHKTSIKAWMASQSTNMLHVDSKLADPCLTAFRTFFSVKNINEKGKKLCNKCIKIKQSTDNEEQQCRVISHIYSLINKMFL